MLLIGELVLLSICFGRGVATSYYITTNYSQVDVKEGRYSLYMRFQSCTCPYAVLRDVGMFSFFCQYASLEVS